MWFCEHSLISKKSDDPFYYTPPVFTLLRNEKLHLAEDVCVCVCVCVKQSCTETCSETQTPISEKILDLGKCCHSSMPFPHHWCYKTPGRTREQCAGCG